MKQPLFLSLYPRLLLQIPKSGRITFSASYEIRQNPFLQYYFPPDACIKCNNNNNACKSERAHLVSRPRMTYSDSSICGESETPASSMQSPRKCAQDHACRYGNV